MKNPESKASNLKAFTIPLEIVRAKLRFLHGNWMPLIAWPLAALVIAGIGWWALVTNLNDQKKETESYLLREVEVLSRGYAEHLTRTVEAIDQFALHVRYEWKLSNGNLELENIEEEGLFPSSSAYYVSILGRDGAVRTSTIAGMRGTKLTDRPAFQVQQFATQDSLYIGRPVLSRIGKKHVMHFSRRLMASDGSFSGAVVISVVLDYFTANYDDTTLGENGFLGIVGGDGDVRAARIGTHVDTSEPTSLVSVPTFSTYSGSFLLDGNEWFQDKRSRYVGWRPVPGYSLIAMTGLDAQSAMSAYWAARASTMRDAISATIGLGIFALIGMGLSMRIAWTKHQLGSIQFAYRVATESGSEGFYIGRPVYDMHGRIVDFEIIDCNHSGAELLLLRREEMIGKKVSSLYGGASTTNLLAMLREAMEVGTYEKDVEVPSESPVTPRWVHVTIVRSGQNLAVTMRDISDTKAHVEELERRGNEDALTGLPNRHWVQVYLPQAIKRAAENNAMLALLFIDLDGFKNINDTMGHSVGDELLRNAGRRLRLAVRPHDHVVRLGGDEFVVILDHVSHENDSAQVAQRVLHAFKESFKLSSGVHSVGASIGISIFPENGADAETLLKNADIAMYSVKTSGKGSYRFYDPKFYEALRARLRKESELRHAIQHDEFIMYYQPRVDISTGTTSSMEALVRWQHPSRGLLEPLEFIALAEETGLIIGIGQLVIDKVCAQLALWEKSGQELVPVSVNVSPRQFNEVDIAGIFSTSLAHHGIDPKLVEIELTESSMMGDSGEVFQALAAIQKMGIKLLVDDFGTGYSSLSQLQRMDFDVLKVDRAFTSEVERSEEGKVFFTAIITMAHALGMRVVAEGVENEKQIKILKSLRCDEIQGFYISRPLPASRTQPILPKWFFPSTA